MFNFNELEEISGFKIDIGKKYLVAFLDILGFKEYVKECFDEKEFDRLSKAKKILEKAILVSIKLPIDQAGKWAYFEEDDIKYKQFSDCICVSVPYSDSDIRSFIPSFFLLVSIVMSYQLNMFRESFYVRGAISSGFHLESENVVFSEGLIKAYVRESKKAVYPRVILDENVEGILKEIYGDELELKNAITRLGIDNVILSDWDNTVFINPFENLIQFSSSEEITAFKKFFQSLLDLNNIKIEREIENRDIPELLKLIKADNLSVVSDKVEGSINEVKTGDKDNITKHHILKKYLWLQELIKWNQKEAFRIKFEYFLK
ncbi:hypothetical protein [Methanobacterium sp. MBAC-LM]|uniref:hypothetical protein n=1 Tax=Methanobacterium sp. MBAC-LM TaxID=3412034 RepID=UPI003C7409CC